MKILLILSILASAYFAGAQADSCATPYRIGKFRQLGTEDLRIDRHRQISKKELKDWGAKQQLIQSQCTTFVSGHPNVAVSKDFSFTVKGFATVSERCESFCGTYEDLIRSMNDEK